MKTFIMLMIEILYVMIIARHVRSENVNGISQGINNE